MRYNYNKDYFSVIDTHDKAYWLGFLYADGCITRFYNKDHSVRSMSLEITLCEQDRKHLEKFNNCLESNISIKERHSKIGNKIYNSFRLTINNTKLCNDLIDLKCTPNKTYSIQFPTFDIVPYIFMRDFIRGYFDGDGCLSITQYYNKPHMVANITGMEDMLSSISSFLFSEKIINKYPAIHKNKRSKAVEIFFYGNDMYYFLDYIYSDSVLHLDRKYQKFIDYYSNLLERYNGVYWSSHNDAYIATIIINNKKIRIGQSKNINDAIKMRKETERKKYEIEHDMPA